MDMRKLYLALVAEDDRLVKRIEMQDTSADYTRIGVRVGGKIVWGVEAYGSMPLHAGNPYAGGRWSRAASADAVEAAAIYRRWQRILDLRGRVWGRLSRQEQNSMPWRAPKRLAVAAVLRAMRRTLQNYRLCAPKHIKDTMALIPQDIRSYALDQALYTMQASVNYYVHHNVVYRRSEADRKIVRRRRGIVVTEPSMNFKKKTKGDNKP